LDPPACLGSDGGGLHRDYHLPPGFRNRAALDGLPQHCLAKAPEGRFFSAVELWGVLFAAPRACDTPSQSHSSQ
jgi:hypothetical protein